nr:uncharacterized protein LOC109781607 [Aegilops tauschii subsp. strangulata]
MCLDFTSLNKACPWDPFPLPRIDQLVDSTIECDLLCFLDDFSGYHHIKMVMEDVEKTTFISPCGVYCYTCMPFGLRSAGATFQGLMHIMLGPVSLRVNPNKCVFGVPSGKLLGFLVSHRGIEANPEKIKAIERMRPCLTLKEMQKLAGSVTSVGRFISKLGERALSFFKLMKWKGSFEWTPKADDAFEDLKRYLTRPPIMVASRSREPLVLYLEASPHSTSATLVTVREERIRIQERPDGPHEPSVLPDVAPGILTPPSHQGFSRLHRLAEHGCPSRPTKSGSPPTPRVSSSTLRYSIKVISTCHLEKVMCNPNAVGRLAEWNVELQAFQLEFCRTRVIKGATLADFMGEWMDTRDGEPGEGWSLLPVDEAPTCWVMHFDGAFSRQGAGDGIVLVYPAKDKLYYTMQLYLQHGEKVSNNIVEYEGLIAGLKAVAALGVKRLTIKGDSELIVNFSNKDYRYLYIAIDKFTKWAEVEPVRTISAGLAIKFIMGLVSRFGIPNRIITDNSSQFTSDLLGSYCSNLGTQVCYASVAHPWSNGHAERANAEVLKGLKTRSLKKNLEACGRGWLDELRSLLWSIHHLDEAHWRHSILPRLQGRGGPPD